MGVLASTITVAEDYVEDAMRTLRFQRDQRNDPVAVGNTWSDYFDFDDFDACDEEIYVIFAFAPLANEPFEVDADWFDSENSGSAKISMMEVNGNTCVEQEEGDGAVERSVAMVMVGVVVAVMGAVW